MAACTAKLSILSLCLSQATTLICLADWGSSVGRCIVKRMSLKVKELQVIRSLIPLVLIIVISWTRHTSLFLVHLESLLNSEEKIIAESLSILTVCALFVHVGAGTNVFGCCRIKILTIKKIFILTWICCDWKSWWHLNWWTSTLIILSCIKNKIVWASSLVFFILNGTIMLSFVFSNTRIVFTDNQLFIDTLINGWTIRCELVLRIFYLARVWKFVSASAWNWCFIIVPAMSIYSKWSLIAFQFLGCNFALSLICIVLLRSWLVE